ncbi:MAG TPA: 30S ribosomal protein S20 [Patescibacteria group bacterium]|nr:30S ribosomal protein S20 [Patescibacteria group bacterium]
MPNKQAAMKAFRQTKKRTAKNRRVKTHLKALTHEVLTLIKAGKKQEAAGASKKLQQALGKAAKEHVIHKNKAAHHTSSVQKAVAAMK